MHALVPLAERMLGYAGFDHPGLESVMRNDITFDMIIGGLLFEALVEDSLTAQILINL